MTNKAATTVGTWRNLLTYLAGQEHTSVRVNCLLFHPRSMAAGYGSHYHLQRRDYGHAAVF